METPQEPPCWAGLLSSGGRPVSAHSDYIANTPDFGGNVGNPMSTSPIDYEAVIADLEAKIAHLQATLAGIKVVAGMNGLGMNPTPSTPSGGGGSPAIVNGKPASDAFLGKSIPEAAKM